MKLRRELILVSLVVIISAALPFLITARAVGGFATTFYDFDVIAVSGQGGVTSLFAAPSINDKGVVSFSGRTGGYNVFISDTLGSYHALNPGGTTNVISGNTQLSVANQIVSLETIIGLNQQLLRIWDGNNLDTSTVIAGSTAAFNDFAAIRPNPTMNNGLQPAFSAQARITFQTLLVTGTRTTTFNQTSLGHPLKPMIADDGRVVVRAGNTATSPIMLYPFNLVAPVTMASSTNFTQLGDSPGISDDGKVVVFFGDASPANTLGLTAGPGIFASVDDGTPNRRVLRMTGRPGELGSDAAGNPIGFNSASYSAFNRATVAHQELGPLGLDGDSFTVCFQAAPTAASPQALFTTNNGLWTLRIDVKLVNGAFLYRPQGPSRVAQIGDVVDGRTITDIVVNDTIANATTDTINGTPRPVHRGENRVAFFASTDSGDIIVRGTSFDTDEDGLPDHWETRGVDFGGGPIDLPAMGASPTHKDIFIHAEWMEPNAGVTYQPKARALNSVITAFQRAPVMNPDGQTGINLHIDAGPNSIMDPRNGKPWKTLSLAGNVHGFQQFIVPFANPLYDWSGLDVMKAAFFDFTRRGPVFHYVLFAHRYGAGDSSGGTRTGRSRTAPGSDFIVTLGSRPTPGGTQLDQAGTFMHELGHNLGLFHGGDEDANYKPNYLSVMNYGFQTTGVIAASRRLDMDYSREALPTLNETSLNEQTGIADPKSHRTVWFDQNRVVRVSGPGPAIDWFFDGQIQNPAPAVDINGDNVCLFPPCPPPTAILRGFNDWPAIVLKGGRIGTSASGLETIDSEDNRDEPSSDELETNMPQELRDLIQCNIEENVTITPEGGGNAPLTVTFDATGSIAPCGTIVSYLWDFGDQTTATGVTVMHTYATPGTYTATLSLTDNSGNTNLLEIDYSVFVSPAGTCGDSIAPAAVLFGLYGGDNGSVNVTAPPGCSWTSVSNNIAWIQVLFGDSGSGNGTVGYVVRENFTGGVRIGTLTIAGQTFTVYQNGDATCTYTVTPIFAVFSSSGGTANITITTSSQCAWQTVSDQSWVTIISSSFGIGNRAVSYSVAPNPGPKGRKAKITIGGQAHNIKQTFP